MTTRQARPRVALDMYVLAQGVKSGVWRVCDELFPRLVASPALDTRLYFRAGDRERAAPWLAAHAIDAPTLDADDTRGADVLLSPFGVAPPAWLRDPSVLQAHIIYDLIAIRRPDYFSEVAAAEVRAIVDHLDEHSVVFAISEATRQDLLAERPDLSPSQVTVIPLAAGPSFKPCTDASKQAAVRARYGIPADVPFVLSLATLEIRKNLDQVVRAFVQHLQDEPQSRMHLVLSGMSGWKLEQLEQALQSAGPWRERIVLTGFVDEEHLSALYSAAQCFIYLSRYEGFGLPPLEAMACGTPVISADNSSLPEVIGDAGLMFDADDVQGVADAIGLLARDEARRAALSEAGLRRAAQFDWDRCAAIVERGLLDAAERHAQRPHNRHPRRTSANTLKQRYGTEQLPITAGLLDYQNGSSGPIFRRIEADDGFASGALQDPWPIWRDALPPGAPDRIEAGLRTRGIFKSGTPERPLVSFVTVVRNNTQTLRRTLDSVQQQQGWDLIEHIVLDGASTDGTLDIILEYQDRIDYIVSEPDAGLYDAINKIIPLARGQLICVLNSDDWLAPDAAAIAAHRMRGMQEPAILATTAHVQAGDFKHEWNPSFVHPGCFFLCANDCHNGMYATREAYERSGPYDTSYKIVADFKWIMASMEAGVRFVYTREPTVNYSLGGTSGDVRRHSLECMRVVSERFPFLTPQEVSGLYHAFFQLAGPVAAQQEGRPEKLGDFVQAEFTRHADRPDFLRALTWAAMAVMRHPAEIASAPAAPVPWAPSIKRSAKDLIKSILYKSPRLYRLGTRGWQRLRK